MKNYLIIPLIFSSALAIFSYQSYLVGFEFKGDENFYFESAKEMIESNDWITPRYFGKPRFEKPILYYWLVASFFELFGINWQVARLPSAISMALVVVLIYIFGLEFFDRKVGMISSAVAVTSISVFRYARLVLPEAFFILVVCGCIYFMLHRIYFWAYLLMGFATLTKGPVGIILPLFIVWGYKYSTGETSFIKELKFFPYIFLTFLVSLPWFFVMVWLYGKSYITHIFFRETIQRIGGLGMDTGSFLKVIKNYTRNLFYFIPIIFIFYLPWSLFLFSSTKKIFLSITTYNRERYGAIFSFVWFFAVFIFFTFLGEKHRHYMLLLMVPFALMTGNYFSSYLNSKKPNVIFVFLLPFFLFFAFESSLLFMSHKIGGIGAIFWNKSYGIGKEDYVGIGSHSILPQELEIYVRRPVERVYFKWPSRELAERETMNVLNKEFFHRKKASYLLIRKEDFERYIWPQTKKRLTFLAKGYIYNKGIKPAELLRALLRFDKESFIDIFREEVWFVTNKKIISNN